MKKKYEAPRIVFDSFELSTNIAGDCEEKTNNPSNSTCGLTLTGNLSVFLETITGCIDFRVDVDENGDGYYGSGPYNTICYHVPFGNNLFNS
jgi:hypothetical protein